MKEMERLFVYVKRESGDKEFKKLKAKSLQKRKFAISKVVRESSDIRAISKRMDNPNIGNLISKFKEGKNLKLKEQKQML